MERSSTQGVLVTNDPATQARLRRSRSNRIMGLVAVLLFCAGAGWWWWNQRPKAYELVLSAGAKLSRRQDFADELIREARLKRVVLANVFTEGSQETLDSIEAGKIDLGYVQGGLAREDSRIRQVAALESEVLHLFVDPQRIDGQQTSDAFPGLRGAVVNVGAAGSGTRVLVDELFRFMGWKPGVDYQPTEFSYEELLALPADKRPVAVFGVAALPWDLGKRFVSEWNYELCPLPFGEALALDDSALLGAAIPAYTYGVNPAHPSQRLETIGTRLLIVARDDVAPEAIQRLLEVIYDGDYARRVGLKSLDPSILQRFRQYPLHAGTEQYLRRNDPVINGDLIESAENLRSFLVSLAIAGVLFWRWRARRRLIGFETYLDRASEIEAEALRWEEQPQGDPVELQKLRRRLSEIKGDALERHAEGTLSGEEHLISFLAHVSDVRSYLDSLYADASRKASFSLVRNDLPAVISPAAPQAESPSIPSKGSLQHQPGE